MNEKLSSGTEREISFKRSTENEFTNRTRIENEKENTEKQTSSKKLNIESLLSTN